MLNEDNTTKITGNQAKIKNGDKFIIECVYRYHHLREKDDKREVAKSVGRRSKGVE